MVSLKLIFTTILIFIVIGSSAMAVATGELVWSKDFNDATNAVNAIDNTQDGNLVFAGLSNGSILAYSAVGVFQWQLNLNGSITKLITMSGGTRLVAMNNKNQTYWIDGSNGIVLATIFNRSMANNISDIGISRDGQYFAVGGNSSLAIFDAVGNPYATNYTYQAQGWNIIAFDPYETWILSTNGINKTFKWNVTSYLGWSEMNYIRDTRNQSNIRDDGFPNKTYYETSTIGDYNLTFIENKSVGANVLPGIIQYYNNFWYNRSITGNLSIRDSVTLVDIVNKTNNNFTVMLNYSIMSGHPKVNIYYGNMSYKSPSYVNGTVGNGSVF